MARFTIKALAVVALVCLVFDLAASDDQLQHQLQHEADAAVTTPGPTTFKDKLKGLVSSVKEGASDAYESVSDSVSGAAHKLDEKRKEAVAGTKKLVNGVVDKIKQSYDSYKHSSEEDVSAVVQEETKDAADKAKSAIKNAM